MGVEATLVRLAAIPAILHRARSGQASLRSFQERHLRRLVRHAYDEVPFYRAIFDRAGVGPEDVRSLADLRRVPLTDKAAMRAAPQGSTFSRSLRAEKMVRYRTGGSTGEPFTILRSRFENHFLEIFRKRAEWQLGFRPWFRCAPVSELPLLGSNHPVVRRLLNAFGLFRIERVDLYRPLPEIVTELERIAPDVIRGYPHTLARVGEEMVKGGRSRIQPRLVMCGGEALTPPLRARIETAFEAPVVDRYGAHEFNLLAWQCPKGDLLHVCDDSVIVEILRDGEPVAVGEEGEVVVTSLFSASQPFIRYRNGDVAVRGPDSCSCGQPFSTLGSVIGRGTDYFPMPDGSLVHPFAITGPMLREGADWIERYQFIRESPRQLRLLLVVHGQPTQEQLESLADIGRRMLPPDVTLAIEIVAEIPQPSNGKFRLYVDLGEEAGSGGIG